VFYFLVFFFKLSNSNSIRDENPYGEVQGPINREPDEKLDPTAAKQSGIRRLYVINIFYFLPFIYFTILYNYLYITYSFILKTICRNIINYFVFYFYFFICSFSLKGLFSFTS
jgi:hypothetical protein